MKIFVEIFLSPKDPSILLKSLLLISEVKRYIRVFDVISELYCVLLRRRRMFGNKSFSRNRPTHILRTVRFLSLDIAPTLGVTVSFFKPHMFSRHFNLDITPRLCKFSLFQLLFSRWLGKAIFSQILPQYNSPQYFQKTVDEKNKSCLL